ncbi:unnamed protein product [Cylicostephanus goldi]|uniref:Potassium channel domain-containing protein n=1 Tax=Cylicostephanus goldi TaxID=71465 RepID=A0A3P6R9I9_CYLGO|nr:unnamed protein product [Cylicostephanus goldi]
MCDVHQSLRLIDQPAGKSKFQTVEILEKIHTKMITDHIHIQSPVEVITKRFLDERCCDKTDIKREIFVASLPYLAICLTLILYVMLGAFVFSAIDDFMDKDNFTTKCFFIFTTLTTIGYGDLAPRNAFSKIFCLIYVGIGVPLLLLALANFGQLFAEFFWTCMMSISPDIHVDPESRRKLPIVVVIALLLIHTMFGAVLFSFWLHKLPFVTAIYFR